MTVNQRKARVLAGVSLGVVLAVLWSAGFGGVVLGALAAWGAVWALIAFWRWLIVALKDAGDRCMPAPVAHLPARRVEAIEWLSDRLVRVRMDCQHRRYLRAVGAPRVGDMVGCTECHSAAPLEWQPTGYRYVTPRTYDEAKAVEGYRRSLTQTAAGRPYAGWR